MKKQFFIFLALLPALLFAYHQGMPNIAVPVPLNPSALEFDFQHRFYGSMLDKPLGTFFGWDGGSNTGYGLRYAIVKGLEVSVARTRWEKEYTGGVSFARPFPKTFISARVGIDGFTYNPDTNRIYNLFPHFELQTEPIFSKIEPVFTAGYDLDRKTIAFGTGLSIVVLRDIGYIREISLVGEYYPFLGDRTSAGPDARINDAFLFGVGLTTYGHQFIITVANGSDIGVRRLARGVTKYSGEKPSLYIGFTIRRLLMRGKEM